MTFADFQRYRKECLASRRGVIDCAETNLYAALATLIPPPTSAPAQTVHRCHLAQAWAKCFGFSEDTAARALISGGVRDSLTQLFCHYAARGATAWLPADNYPVYWELARAAGLAPRAFPTLPTPIWPTLPPATGEEILLVTNPLKPLGRWLEPPEIAALKAWLAASQRRRLLLDAVYTFDVAFHRSTLELIATGQTILLHSLTKGWLQPRLFGVALIPESDFEALAPVFRANVPSQGNLARASAMLTEYAGLPKRVGGHLIIAWPPLFQAAWARDLSPTPCETVSYLFPVFGEYQELLARRNILGLPATVFGSPHEDLTILSSLSFVQCPPE
jgi:hypothetical protein